MTIEGGVSRAGLAERAKNILFKPKTEWAVIDTETTTIKDIYLGYVVILALIPAVVGLIVSLIFASMMGAFGGVFGVGLALSPVFAVLSAVVSYAISLIMVIVMGLLIDALAPSFGAVKNRVQAVKVAAYSATALWVGSLGMLIPLLGILVVIAAAVYAVYLIHLGLRQLMQAPEDKGAGYTAVVVVVSIIAAFLINLVLNIPLGIARTASLFGSRPAAVTVNLPNGTKINVDEAADAAEKFAKEMETAAANGEITVNGGTATDGSTLQGLLPAALPGGYARTEVSSGGMSGVAMGAEAVYTKGASRIELNVVDSGALGALAGMAGGMQSNKTTANGYEKMGQVNGRLTTEEFDRSNNSGKYGVIVGRFMVEAEGTGVSIPELKAAVEAVPFARLEALAKS